MEQQTKPKSGAPDPAPESKPAAAAKPNVAAKRKRAAAARSKRKPVARPKSTAKSSRARGAARTGGSKPALTLAGTTSPPEESRAERTPDRARQWAAHVLGAQDEVAQALARYQRRAAASPGMPPLLSTLMKSQAELVRSASDVYVSTARRFLDGTARAEQPRR